MTATSSWSNLAEAEQKLLMQVCLPTIEIVHRFASGAGRTIQEALCRRLSYFC